ncbi:hypothetical protein I7I53_04885 [Histoplasma capsulatum var. duboisii H88]|uniref:Uncharacterized protein n=1 Tax=Ajellomyces capsulatus (strain H88) TaxID=544711 RepID=A0A8A1LRS5_AJEC8|nr:hypothetical protein I7I53_04885 [Histoplasma capsulatum var. duboisii H88]
MEQVHSQLPPFSIRLLGGGPDDATTTSQSRNDKLWAVFPASYRTSTDDLAAPSYDYMACMEKELDVRRLNKIFKWLWVVGRPMPPRPLHYQLLLGREIFVTEQMDMHLVWAEGRVYLKPIPRFLLEPNFWSEYLSCRDDCKCLDHERAVGSPAHSQECSHRKLRKSALGFLYSYAALISHESDFYIAKDKRLLPSGEDRLTWQRWRTFVEQLDTAHIYPNINPRFIYGELRLSRLNNIYRFTQRPFLGGYTRHWQEYKTFFRDNFTWLASATVYAAIVLAAMQVGLETKALSDSAMFHSASYGFTVFSILGPLAATGCILLAFFLLFLNNLVVALAYEKKRFYHINTGSGRP